MKRGLSIVGQESRAAPTEHSDAEPDRRRDFRGRAAVVTLGCAKNQVDSEVMVGVLERSGFEIVPELTDADVAVVNTCGFLQSSVKESIDAILSVADLKREGRLRRLIVAGCLVERFKGGDLRGSMPEVDSFISLDQLLEVGRAAGGAADLVLESGARPYFLYDDTMPRRLASARHTAYVKISEGCDRPCAFCIIPKLRGAMRSRDLESVAREAAALGSAGVREINLVAQDLTAYRCPSSGRNLAALLAALDGAGAVDWIRLLYAYPLGIDRELLDAVASLPRVCNYLDLPLQHASERVLKAMRRPLGKYAPRKLVPFMRDAAPGVALRTTFIVGFPGETEADIRELEEFIAEGHFMNVGVFTYSREDGTPAALLDEQIPEKLKRERRDRLMEVQQRVVQRRLGEFVGRTLDVLVEGPHEETDLLLAARTAFQAPEVDGTVMINEIADGAPVPERGAIVPATVTDVCGYDLVARIERPAPLH